MASLFQFRTCIRWGLPAGGRVAALLTALLVTAVVTLGACSPGMDSVPAPSPSHSPPPTWTEIQDTPVIHNQTAPTSTAEPDLTPSPSLAPETPDFSVVQDRPADFQAWRPPVYPVPWYPSPQDHFLFQNPIAAFDIDPAYSTYGYGDVFFENVVHTGIDIPGDIGTPILAAGPGRVIYAGQGVYRGGENVYDDPYGKAVVIQHDFSYQGEALFTLYAHLSEILVQKNQIVAAGEVLGLMGETGKTTGPHLHFEVRVGKNEYFSTRNPDLWLSPPQGWGILVGQILTYEGRLHEQQIVYLVRMDEEPQPDLPENQIWISKSYRNEAINPDPYYKENLTIANIPAGTYLLTIPVTQIGYSYQRTVEIQPGQVTFVKFNVWKGFSDASPEPPEIFFQPSP